MIREYIWVNGTLVGVFEAGQLYFVRTDQIGRPVFATDNTGTKVWEATYLPFGGLHTSTGPNSDLRFPGQWFQSGAGLHQNWMRDYDPALGRYLQPDPLGLIDGPSVYGYALQNPGRYTDPRGEQGRPTIGSGGPSAAGSWGRPIGATIKATFDAMNNSNFIVPRGCGGDEYTSTLAYGDLDGR